MFNRLVFLLMLILATLSVSPSAHATTLTVSLDCVTAYEVNNLYHFGCSAQTVCGVGPATFQWYRNADVRRTETSTTGSSQFVGLCQAGLTQTIQVVVIDSTSEQASATRTFPCG